jgi:hypothetical protein
MLSGQVVDHGILVVSVGIVNLQPSMRMSLHTLQPITFAFSSDAKKVGMVEILHGGTSSLGAQVARRVNPSPLRLRNASGTGYEEKDTSYRILMSTCDFPAFAEGTSRASKLGACALLCAACSLNASCIQSRV